MLPAPLLAGVGSPENFAGEILKGQIAFRWRTKPSQMDSRSFLSEQVKEYSMRNGMPADEAILYLRPAVERNAQLPEGIADELVKDLHEMVKLQFQRVV